MNIDLYNLAGKERSKQPAGGTGTGAGGPGTGGTPPPAPPTNTTPFQEKQQVILTQFLGGQNEMHFTTLNHVRTHEDAQESDQAEVGYYLKACSNRLHPDKTSSCLWRRESPIIDKDVSKGGYETVLLENVTKFELRYIGPGRVPEEADEWPKEWYTNERGDEVTKNKFPYAVEITIEMNNKNIEGDKPISMTMVAELRFAERKAPESGDANAKTGDPNADPTGKK